MIENLSDYVELLIKHSLTPNQFLLLVLTHEKRIDLIYKYSELGRGFTRKEIEDLENRGYIININKNPDELYADSIVVTDKFLADYQTDDNSLAEEFLAAYPSYIWIDGKKIPAKNMEPDELYQLYAKKTRNNPTKHKMIMQCLGYAKRTLNINMGIEKWVKTEQWRVIKEEMESKDENESSPNNHRF